MTDFYRCIIAGSQSATRADVAEALRACPWTGRIKQVICGCAPGADTHGRSIAIGQGVEILDMPADWDLHGRAAGPIRNAHMARAADALILVWDGTSPGSRDMLQRACEYKLQIYVHMTNSRKQD